MGCSCLCYCQGCCHHASSPGVGGARRCRYQDHLHLAKLRSLVVFGGPLLDLQVCSSLIVVATTRFWEDQTMWLFLYSVAIFAVPLLTTRWSRRIAARHWVNESPKQHDICRGLLLGPSQALCLPCGCTTITLHTRQRVIIAVVSLHSHHPTDSSSCIMTVGFMLQASRGQPIFASGRRY